MGKRDKNKIEEEIKNLFTEELNRSNEDREILDKLSFQNNSLYFETFDEIIRQAEERNEHLIADLAKKGIVLPRNLNSANSRNDIN